MCNRWRWGLSVPLALLPLLLGSHPPAEWPGGSGAGAADPGWTAPLRTPPRPVPGFRASPSPPPPAPPARRPITPSRFRLRKGEAVRLRVGQSPGDLRVAVRGPGGETLLEVDAFNGRSGPEDLTIVAPERGLYRIEGWGSPASGRGPYRASVVVRRKALSEDRARWRAAWLTWKAEGAAPRAARLLDLNEALDLYLSLGDRGGIADLSFLLGSAHEAGGDGAEAERHYRRASRLYRRLPSRTQRLVALQNLALLRLQRGDLRGARTAGREGVEAASGAGLPWWRAHFLVILGMADIERGRPERALPLLESAVALEDGAEDPAARAEALNALGRAHYKLGNCERALELHGRALDLLDPRRDAEVIARTLHHLGDAYAASGDGGRAFFRLHWADRIWTRLENRAEGAVTLNSLAKSALAEGDLAAAFEAQRRAVALFRQGWDAAGTAQAVANLAWIHAARREPERALALAAEAGSLAGRPPRKGLAAYLHLVRARAFGQAGDLRRSWEEARLALALVEARRGGIEPAEFRLGFAPAVQSYYEVAIEALMALHALEPGRGWNRAALEVSERARARVLLDSLEGRPAEPGLSVAEIQGRLLDGDTVLLEIFLGARKGFLWRVTRDDVQSFEIPGRERLRGLLARVGEAMPRSDRTADLRDLHRRAGALGRALFGPLGRLPEERRLLLVVPPELQSLSFQALPDPFRPAGRGGAEEWPDPLLLARTIVVEPSMAVLAALRRKGPPALRGAGGGGAPGAIAAFVSPRYSGPGAAGPREHPPLSCRLGDLVLPLPPLPPLRFGLAEARSLAAAAGGGELRVFSGAEATAARFLGLDFRPFRYLYLSGHGRPDPTDAGRSALLLSAFDGEGRPIEPCLFAGDVARLDLSADLVVLSACASGLGRVTAGEGLLGLGSAFLTAGARRVGVALWDVQEGPTALLMDAFNRRYLGEGMEPAEALRGAQIEMWRKVGFAAPAFWGGFQIVGDWGPGGRAAAGAAASAPAGPPERPAGICRSDPGVGRFRCRPQEVPEDGEEGRDESRTRSLDEAGHDRRTGPGGGLAGGRSAGGGNEGGAPPGGRGASRSEAGRGGPPGSDDRDRSGRHRLPPGAGGGGRGGSRRAARLGVKGGGPPPPPLPQRGFVRASLSG